MHRRYRQNYNKKLKLAFGPNWWRCPNGTTKDEDSKPAAKKKSKRKRESSGDNSNKEVTTKPPSVAMVITLGTSSPSVGSRTQLSVHLQPRRLHLGKCGYVF